MWHDAMFDEDTGIALGRGDVDFRSRLRSSLLLVTADALGLPPGRFCGKRAGCQGHVYVAGHASCSPANFECYYSLQSGAAVCGGFVQGNVTLQPAV